MKHKKKEPNPVNKQGLTTCHPGPDPGPRAFLDWMPDQVRHDKFENLSDNFISLICENPRVEQSEIPIHRDGTLF